MTVEFLEQAQNGIWRDIEQHAKELGYGEQSPIYDGVCDIAGYLSSRHKTMWILKEPNGQLEGGGLEKGGWVIPNESFTDLGVTASQPTWQVIIYVMYGYLNGLMYDDMDYIHNKIEMARVMQSIAYLNVSKMPGYSKSIKNNIEQFYIQWKSILNKQIEIYAPDVIVFGNTFDHFKNDFENRGLEKIGNSPDWIDVYKSGQVILLDAYHPSRKGRKYVDTLIETLNKYLPIVKY